MIKFTLSLFIECSFLLMPVLCSAMRFICVVISLTFSTLTHRWNQNPAKPEATEYFFYREFSLIFLAILLVVLRDHMSHEFIRVLPYSYPICHWSASLGHLSTTLALYWLLTARTRHGVNGHWSVRRRRREEGSALCSPQTTSTINRLCSGNVRLKPSFWVVYYHCERFLKVAWTSYD